MSVSDTGDPLEIDVYAADGRWLGFAGMDVPIAEATTVRLRGALHNSEGEARVAQLIRVKPGSCNDLRAPLRITAPEVDFEVLLEVEVQPDESFDIHTEVQLAADEVVFGWLRPAATMVIGRHGAAVTNAVRGK